MWIDVAITPLVAENTTKSVSPSTARPVCSSAVPAHVSSTSSPPRYAAAWSPTSRPLATSSSSSPWTSSTVLRVSSITAPPFRGATIPRASAAGPPPYSELAQTKEGEAQAMAVDVATLRPRNRAPRSGRELSNPEAMAGYIWAAEAALAEPFRGVTTDGQPVAGLFPLRETGVPTTPILRAVEAFLGALDAEQARGVGFPIESDQWRRWSNIHPFTMRHGLCLERMTPAQVERA